MVREALTAGAELPSARSAAVTLYSGCAPCPPGHQSETSPVAGAAVTVALTAFSPARKATRAVAVAPRGDVVDGAPLRLQDVEADLPVGVDVRVEDVRDEAHLRRLVRVLLRELEHEVEGTPLPRRVVRAEDDRRPEHDVVGQRRRVDARRRVAVHLLEVAHEAPARGGRHAARAASGPGGGRRRRGGVKGGSWSLVLGKPRRSVTGRNNTEDSDPRRAYFVLSSQRGASVRACRESARIATKSKVQNSTRHTI